MAEFEVPQPIICSPFDEPRQHWLLEEGADPRLEPGRRAAHYFYRAPGAETGDEGAPVGERVDLPLVNRTSSFGCEMGLT
jgi:type III restriction enzyme